MATALEQIGGLLGLTGAAASAYLPYQESGAQLDYLKERVPQYTQAAQDITNRAVEAAQFTPFTVKTATGGTTGVGAGGAIDQQLGTQEQALMQSMFDQAQGMAGQPTATAADIYSQLQAASAGEQQRQQLELENRLAAQGRLGVGTAMYGGTPEQLALQKAIQEQQSKNWLSAQTLAPQLASQQLANTNAALAGAYVPQQQSLAALQAASPFSQLATSAALSQAEQLSSGGQYGLEAMVAGDQTIGSLESARTQALANTLGSLFSTSKTGDSTVTSLLDSIFG